MYNVHILQLIIMDAYLVLTLTDINAFYSEITPSEKEINAPS